MSGLPEEVRGLTDNLDAACNTIAGISKGFNIESAALASLVVRRHVAYAFAAWTLVTAIAWQGHQ